LPRLQNPVRGARLIATTLQSVGFQLIGAKGQTDLDRAGLALSPCASSIFSRPDP
jgi:hypothetical protein